MCSTFSGPDRVSRTQLPGATAERRCTSRVGGGGSPPRELVDRPLGAGMMRDVIDKDLAAGDHIVSVYHWVWNQKIHTGLPVIRKDLT